MTNDEAGRCPADLKPDMVYTRVEKTKGGVGCQVLLPFLDELCSPFKSISYRSEWFVGGPEILQARKTGSDLEGIRREHYAGLLNEGILKDLRRRKAILVREGGTLVRRSENRG